VVGDRGLGKGVVEYRQRRSGDSSEVELDGIVDFVLQQIESQK
jgi:hypothetical protein